MPELRDRRYSDPVIVSDFSSDGAAAPVLRPSRLPLTLKPGEKGEFDEAWLQDLIYRYPELLPVCRIQPAFDGLIRLSREVPVAGAGNVDALFVNRMGYPTLVEVKLFRNQEARSDVVGQTIDYLKQMTTWSVREFAEAIARGDPTALTDGRTSALQEYLARETREAYGELDEPGWLDTLQENISNGRVLLLIVGDGIQSNVQEMAAVLQGWPQFNFTLALVELLIYAMDDGRKLIVPQVVAKTEQIERFIVRYATPELRTQVTVEGVPTAERAARRLKFSSTEDFLVAVEKAAGVDARAAAQNLFEFLQDEPDVKLEYGSSSCSVKVKDPRGSGQSLSLFFIEARGTMVFGGWMKDQQLPRLELPGTLADEFSNKVVPGYALARDRDGYPKGLTLARYAQNPAPLHEAVRMFAKNVRAAAEA